MNIDNQISYVEFKAKDLNEIVRFYSEAFGWEFKAWGENYLSFSGAGVEGGFERTGDVINNGALVILYHKNLESIMEQVKAAGGTIAQEIYGFPGGRRFNFIDPSGNELAIWSELDSDGEIIG